MMNFAWDYSDTGGCEGLVAGPFWQLGRCFDLSAVAAALRRCGAMPESIGCIGIENVWFIPGKALHVVYGAAGGPPGPWICAVRYFPAGKGAACSVAHLTDEAERSHFHVPELEGVASVFPSDRALPQLGELIRGASSAAAVARAAGRPVDALRLGWRLFSYLPGERCTVGLAEPGGDIAVVAKVQRSVARGHAAMHALWRHEDRGFRMAEPLMLDQTLGARWERFMPGQRLEAIPAGEGLEASVAQAMAALAALNRITLDGLPVRDAGVALDRLRGKVLKRIASAVPSVDAAARMLAETLAARLPAPGTRPCVTIHGDFHTANVLFDDGDPVFIDLDEIAAGDPAYDLALFATRLLLAAALRPQDRAALATLAASLPRHYREAGGEAVPDPVFAWFVATLLVGRQVKTCIRHAAPRSAELSRTLIGWATRVLARGALEPADLN